MTAELDRIRAYESAVAHPFHVRAFTSWADHQGIAVGFQTEADARAFAAGRPEPLVDLVSRQRGPRVIASRRLVAHPDMPAGNGWQPVDDFPQVEDVDAAHDIGDHDDEAVPGCDRCDELMSD